MWIREKRLWTLPYHTSFDTLLHERCIMCHMASLHIISQSHPEAGEIKHDPVYFTPWFWWIWSPSARKCHSLNKGSLHFVLSLMRPIHLLLDTQDFLDSQDLSSDVRDETFKELMFPAAALSVDVAFFCLFLSFILAFVPWVTERIWINIIDFAIWNQCLCHYY